jgi:multiple sugar transport system permease protein
MIRRLLSRISLLLLILIWSVPASAQTTIRMMAGLAFGIPPKEATTTNAQIRRAVFDEFHKENPDIRVENAGGLNLVGDLADNMFLMSMAGDNAPDIFYVNFRQYYTFLDQGFCRPLDDLIAQDPQVAKRINPTVKSVLTSYDGRTYAIPFFQVALALYFRKDYFIRAGLDPTKPPRNWKEFTDDCRTLVSTGTSKYGWENTSGGPSYYWQNFVYQAGGEVVRRDSNGNWSSAVDSPQAATALDFYGSLMRDKWKDRAGKEIGPACDEAHDLSDDIRTGKTGMWFGYTNDVVMQSQNDLSPTLIGIAALPAGPAGQKNEVNAGMWAINSRVKDPKKLAACWRFIKYFAGDAAARVNTEKCVELGMGRLVNPTWLKKFGYQDLLAQVDPAYVKANEQLFTTGHPEPYGKNCQQVYSILDHATQQKVLDPSMSSRAILGQVSREMDAELLGYAPPEQRTRQRAWAYGILVCLILAISRIVSTSLGRAKNAFRVQERLPAGVDRRKLKLFMGICLLPAVGTILVWSYYPLGKGLIIAFQNYTLMHGTSWVGLDNFISVFTQPVFYKSLLNSFLFVGLSLLIGFFIPIFLALALNEIPFGRVLFRTIYYLPAMTSSFVVALVWRQFYDKTSDGLLNSLLAPVITHFINPVLTFLGNSPVPLANDWLGNPSLAMFAVVLPGIWAGSGAGSILYLAALKNVSQDRYEAADIDGASWVQKIRYITLPSLRPLILINLLGVFIGGFKSMENVFVLTQGGPLNATRTIGLEVWQNAFMYLKFGYATAAAWVMGSILIGFTIFQIRSLMGMKFSAGS